MNLQPLPKPDLQKLILQGWVELPAIKWRSIPIQGKNRSRHWRENNRLRSRKYFRQWKRRRRGLSLAHCQELEKAYRPRRGIK
jgi:hypothetical protein